MYFLKELTKQDNPKLMRVFEEDKARTAHSSMFTYFTETALVTTERKGFMQLVNLKTGMFQTYLTHFDGGHIPRTGPLQFAALSPALYVAHRECHHVLYCLGTSNELLCGNFHTGQVAVIGEFSSRPSCVFADGEYAACGTSDGTVHVWRATTLLYDGYDLRYSPHPGDESIQKSFSFAGGGINTSGSSSRHNVSGAEAVLKVNDSGSILWRRKAHRSAIKAIQVERDFLIVACADFTVAVHSLHGTGEQLASFQYDSHVTIGITPLGPSAHRLGPSPRGTPSSVGIDFGVLNLVGEMRMYGAGSPSSSSSKGTVMSTDGAAGRVNHGANPGGNWMVLGAPLQLAEVTLEGIFTQLTPTCVVTRNSFLLVGTAEGYVVVYTVGPAPSSYPITELCVLNIGAAGGDRTDAVTDVAVLADDHLVVLTKSGSVWRWPMSEVMLHADPGATLQTNENDISEVGGSAAELDQYAHQHQHSVTMGHSNNGDEDRLDYEDDEAIPEARSTVQAPTPQDHSSNLFPNGSSNNNSGGGHHHGGMAMDSSSRQTNYHHHESMSIGDHIQAPFSFEEDDGEVVVEMNASETEEEDAPSRIDDGATDASVAVPSTLRGGGGGVGRRASSLGVTFSNSPSSITGGGGRNYRSAANNNNNNHQAGSDDDGAASGTNLGSDMRALQDALDVDGGGGITSHRRSPRNKIADAMTTGDSYNPQAYAPTGGGSSMHVAIPTISGLKEGRRADPRKVAALVSQLKDHTSESHREGLFVSTATVESSEQQSRGASPKQVSPRDVDEYKIANQMEVNAMRIRIAQHTTKGGTSSSGYRRGDAYFADPELQTSRMGDLSRTDDITGGGLVLMAPSSNKEDSPSVPSSSPHRRDESSPPLNRLTTNTPGRLVGSSPIGGGGGDESMDSAMLGSQAGEGGVVSSSSPSRRVGFSPQHHNTRTAPSPSSRTAPSPPRQHQRVVATGSSPIRPSTSSDDLVDATFHQYARKVDEDYNRKRAVPGPNIHAHLCDALLHSHLAPTNLGHVSALELTPPTPTPPVPSSRVAALRSKSASLTTPLSDLTRRADQVANATPTPGMTVGKAKECDGQPLPPTTTTLPQYVPDVVFFFEPEMRWSTTTTGAKASTLGDGGAAVRIMGGPSALLTSDESNSLFGKDPFDDCALPAMELPLGTMM